MSYARSPSSVTDPPLHRLVARHLLQWLLPSPCLRCREIVWEPRGSLGLCPDCRLRLARWPRSGCGTCGRLLASAPSPPAGPCADCRARPPAYDRLISTWCYESPLDDVVMGLKFRRLDYLGEHLGQAMAEIHREDLADRETVVPVPLYWTRHLTRGFNQAAIMARTLARELGLPFAQPLARRRSTPPQSRLGRSDRQHNLDRAFTVRRRRSVRGHRVLLVDDVTTTGATLAATAACLKEAGARSVVALTAARTPTESESVQLRRLG